MKTSKFTCFYAASSSRRLHAIARYKARKSQVSSLAGCMLTYLKFAGEFTRGVIADFLKLQVFSCAVAGIFSCDCGGIFACVCSYFACVWQVLLPAIIVFLPASFMYFCLQKQAILHASRGKTCMSSACKFTCKIPTLFR